MWEKSTTIPEPSTMAAYNNIGIRDRYAAVFDGSHTGVYPTPTVGTVGYKYDVAFAD